MEKDLVIGIDVGGQTSKCGIVDARGTVLSQTVIRSDETDKPEDFVIATGEQHSVREFAYHAFKAAGIELEFKGEGMDEKGICVSGPANLVGKTLVEVSEDFYRPTDVVNLWGDPTKARQQLGWNPTKTTFDQLVSIMVKHDMEKVAADHVASVMRTNLAEYLERGLVK